MLPETTVPAREQTRELSWLSRRKLLWGLHALERGDVNPAAIHVYEDYPNDPAWQRVVFGGDLVVIFRALTAAERGVVRSDPPHFLVVRVVNPDEELPALEALVAEKHAQETKGKAEEEGGHEHE